MNERVVENWLTSVSERGYEVPFTQLLSARGHTILQGPIHHGHEYGKDIITLGPSGLLCAFQLKGSAGGERLGLTELRQYEAQLFELSAAAVRLPSVHPARAPDEVFLVTNQVLTPEARGLLGAISDANRAAGRAPLDAIERDRLLGWFVESHGRFFPEEPKDLSGFLRLYLSDGRDLPDLSEFFAFLHGLMPLPRRTRTTKNACRGAIVSASLFTSYATRRFEEAENHLAVAQLWLALASQVLYLAALYDLREEYWRDSYELALTAGRHALERLVHEAAARPDLIGSHITDGLVYGARALLVCGYTAALRASLRTSSVDHDVDQMVALVRREQPFIKIHGESGTPLFYATALFLTMHGEVKTGEGMLLNLIRELANSNQPGSDRALPDPYHSTDEILSALLENRQGGFDDERYDGHAYTLHPLVEWAARRLWRQQLNSLWHRISKITQIQLNPSAPAAYLLPVDDEGELHTWLHQVPTSWSRLRAGADLLERRALPAVLVDHLEFVPFVPLLLPNRFTAEMARLVDHAMTGAVEIV
ncbi:MAG: hypothetical protein AMXMBFR53_07070 [Gemmatimonadota bacterium]